MRRLSILLLLAAVSLAADEVLTNDHVIRLVRAGLSADTIEVKISGAATAFDVSTDALVALAEDGVPDRVIRAMLKSGATAAAKAADPVPSPAPSPASPAPSPAARPAMAARRFDVAIHSDRYARCHDGELRIDSKGVKGSRCRGLDFELAWSSITGICHQYGFRGVVVFTAGKAEHRISTTTPAEAKRIVEQVRPWVASSECR